MLREVWLLYDEFFFIFYFLVSIFAYSYLEREREREKEREVSMCMRGGNNCSCLSFCGGGHICMLSHPVHLNLFI